MNTTKLILPLLAVGALASSTAQANLISGSIWENTQTVAPIISEDGSLANAATLLAGRPADVTFSVNSPINFNSSFTPTGYTIGGFLATGGALITGGASGLASAGNTINNTLFYITGNVTVANGQMFNVQHDDGLQLKIGGTLVVDVPGPTAPVVTPYTWTGPSGTYPFELAYAEVEGAPGVLAIDLPLAAVPEPSTYLAGALLALPFGLNGLRSLRSRKQKA